MNLVHLILFRFLAGAGTAAAVPTARTLATLYPTAPATISTLSVRAPGAHSTVSLRAPASLPTLSVEPE